MSLAARRKARLLVCQAIYQWQVTQDDTQQIYNQFVEDNYGKNYEEDYFSGIFFGVIKTQDKLDELFIPYLQDKSLVELTNIELALLRIATYELTQRPDIPINVVLVEAVRLAKKFGATDSYKFVNAVLDKLARSLPVNG